MGSFAELSLYFVSVSWWKLTLSNQQGEAIVSVGGGGVVPSWGLIPKRLAHGNVFLCHDDFCFIDNLPTMEQ